LPKINKRDIPRASRDVFFLYDFPNPQGGPPRHARPHTKTAWLRRGFLGGASAFADFEMLPLRVLMFPNTKKFKITPFYAKMIK
jgi:hypothetical protein